ncbi:hypothetical protein [Micromonospora thermarum]|uniref:Uncharacterized protein n=1 Tax=Micromonospora thermarum TaxID=2720024 RepID=A0ABX0Z8C0_9ACTN|nr:hypothetical protein [Micromonospora thermarum]NJP32629.1 hypothetical protein [Micromonospora thermarum]
MQVLFLALGGTRRRAVTEESARAVADGASAVVLVEQRKTWHRDEFDPGVEVVELARLEALHPPRRVEKVLLYRGPGAVFKVVGRGPLRPFVARAKKAYERRIAAPAHRALILPRQRKAWGDVRQRLIHRHVLAGRAPFDLVVVSDPDSMPTAARLVAGFAAGGLPEPQIAYSYDNAGFDPAVGPRTS